MHNSILRPSYPAASNFKPSTFFDIFFSWLLWLFFFFFTKIGCHILYLALINLSVLILVLHDSEVLLEKSIGLSQCSNMRNYMQNIFFFVSLQTTFVSSFQFLLTFCFALFFAIYTFYQFVYCSFCFPFSGHMTKAICWVFDLYTVFWFLLCCIFKILYRR